MIRTSRDNLSPPLRPDAPPGRRPSHATRRRLIATLGACALAVGGALASTAPASATVELRAADLQLTKTAATNGPVNKLDRVLPRVSVSDVLDDANRDLTACSKGLPNELRAYCWEGGAKSGDQGTDDWYPQGVSSSADATASGTYEGRQVLLTSWYDHNSDAPEKGSRVSFVDRAALPTSAPDYRHVLLVEPYNDKGGKANFRAVPVHAGGIAWYGNYLYVVDTWEGIRVFDLNHLWKVKTGDKDKIGRQSDGSYQAFDYAYVLPQVFRYQDSVAPDSSQAEFRHSSIGLDRTSSPDSIVMSEYRAAADAQAGQKARVVRFDLNETNRLLKTDRDGVARGDELYDTEEDGIQGGLAINGTFLFSESDGENNNGDLLRLRPPHPVENFTNHLPKGTEDLTYWNSRDELWTASEWPGNRALIAVKASAYLP